MRAILLLAVIALGVMAPTTAFAGAADVNAQEFYRDAKELEAMGLRAMFDRRAKPRIAQMKAAGEEARAANAEATRRGQPLYCVSEAARKKGLDAKQALALLGRVPESERRTSTLAQAWRRALIIAYPCR